MSSIVYLNYTECFLLFETKLYFYYNRLLAVMRYHKLVLQIRVKAVNLIHTECPTIMIWYRTMISKCTAFKL